MKSCPKIVIKSHTRVIALILGFLMILGSGLGCGVDTPQPNPTDKPTDTPSPSITQPEQKEDISMEIDVTNRIETLGLCVTDGGFDDPSAAKAEMRFKDLKNCGVQTIRLETTWDSPAEGVWTLLKSDADKIRAAKRNGLRLKLILPTIMKPPSRIYNDTGARLINEDGKENLQNTVSYWYDGLYDYTEDAINSMLAVLDQMDVLDVVDAVIVDCGPAGEPLYPAAWTQNAEREALWCYADNAIEDFRRVMQEKYQTIDKANTAWETAYTDFSAVSVPKPGTVKGTFWQDVLSWYRDTKRDFIDQQCAIFKRAVDKYNHYNIHLLLYMPGEAYTDGDFTDAIESGTTTGGICICSENEIIVEYAAKYGCLLQFTGLPGTASVKKVLSYMVDNGYSDIPVYGENFADVTSAADPIGLGKILLELGLSGIDYTFDCYLYESAGYKKNAVFSLFSEAIDTYKQAIVQARTKNYTQALAITQKEALPESGALALQVTCSSTSAEYRVTIPNLSYTIQSGDLLEYDVYVPDGCSGVGSVDGGVSGKLDFYSNIFVTDRYGNGLQTQEGIQNGHWEHRTITIGIDYNPFDRRGNYVGTRLFSLSLTGKPKGTIGKTYTVLYDNICITNQGKVQYSIFASEGDIPTNSCKISTDGCNVSILVQ